MFGKGKRTQSSNDKFIMKAGVAAGNLKGRGTSAKTAPTAKGSSMDVPKPAKRRVSPGKAGPVKITGD